MKEHIVFIVINGLSKKEYVLEDAIRRGYIFNQRQLAKDKASILNKGNDLPYQVKQYLLTSKISVIN